MMKRFVLVRVIATLILVSECIASNSYHDYGETRKYVEDAFTPNDRGLENNRDFSTMIQDGFIYGAFKVTGNRGKLDCVDEGLTIARGMYGIAYRRFVSREYYTEMDVFNLAEWAMTLSERCNYHATIQGIIVAQIVQKHISDRFEGHRKWQKFINFCMLSYEGAVNMIDDSVVMAMAGLGFYSHGDPYNAAIIVGKVVKMCYQFYLEGFMF